MLQVLKRCNNVESLKIIGREMFEKTFPPKNRQFGNGANRLLLFFSHLRYFSVYDFYQSLAWTYVYHSKPKSQFSTLSDHPFLRYLDRQTDRQTLKNRFSGLMWRLGKRGRDFQLWKFERNFWNWLQSSRQFGNGANWLLQSFRDFQI